MASSLSHNVLVANAFTIYLHYLLRAALAFRERITIYSAANRSFPYPVEMTKRLEGLVEYLQDSVRKPVKLHVLASKMAVIDRWRDSIGWSLVTDMTACISRDLAKLSADFLRFSIDAEESGDTGLSNEWRLASRLSEVAIRAPGADDSDLNLDRYEDHAPEADAVTEKTLACRFIAEMLTYQNGAQSLVHQYRTKVENLQQIRSWRVTLRAAEESLQLLRDERLQGLHDRQQALMSELRVELRLMYETPEVMQPSQGCGSLASRLKLLSDLRTGVNLMLDAANACQRTLHTAAATTGGMPDYLAPLQEMFVVLCEERDVVLMSISREFPLKLSAHTPQPTDSAVQQLSATAGRVRKVALRLSKEITTSVRITSLAAFYTAEAEKAALRRPCTKFHQKITECWQRAADAAVRRITDDNPTRSWEAAHGQYAALAEGIFDSAVTCHTQWERAVQRRDDKLADFWQRARERAWEVGCEAFDAGGFSASGSCVAESVYCAVEAASRVQELRAQTAAQPLAGVEADLHLLLAEVFISASRAVADAPPPSNDLEQSVKLALNATAMLSLQLGGAVGADVREVLDWIACSLGKLQQLGGGVSGEDSGFAVVTSLIKEIVERLQREESFDSRELAQRMFLADLHILKLQAHCKGNAATAWWCGLLARTTASARESLSPLTAPGCVRWLLARALEDELTENDAEASVFLRTQWPHSRCGLAVVENCSTELTQVVADIVAAYRYALQWKRRAAEERDTVLQDHLEEGSSRWAALAKFRLERAEYVEWRKEAEGGSTTAWMDKSLVVRGEGRKLVVEVTDAGLRALQVENLDAHQLCKKVCADLELLTTGDRLVFEAYQGDRYAMPCAERVVKEILTCADHYLRAVEAELAGRRSIAVAWKHAAQLRDHALDRRHMRHDLREMLSYNADAELQRADALAAQARKMEETVARNL